MYGGARCRKMAIGKGTLMRKILLILLFPVLAFPLEVAPWFGEVYQFYFRGSYAYSYFSSFQNAAPPLSSSYHANVAALSLEVSPSPRFDVDVDVEFAATTQMSPNFRSAAVQARYSFLDDIVGDPLSVCVGGSVRATLGSSLRDITCPSHGYADFEVAASLGKEWDPSTSWQLRTWGYMGLGQATQGSPWVRGIVGLDFHILEKHFLEFLGMGICGYGRRVHVDVEDFFGYGRVRERAIDVACRYGRRLGVFGTLYVSYMRRVLAKSAPSHVNTFQVAYTLPFSL